MNEEHIISEKINLPKDLFLIIKKTPIVIIKVSASWCGPCKNKIFLESYNKLKSSYSQISEIKFIELDVDDDANILNDTKYYNIDITSIPTFLISKNSVFTRKYIGCVYLNEINEYIYNNITK